MPHISKENIYELASMSNEVKAYLEKLYPECFDCNFETPLEKAKRLYKRGTKVRNMISGKVVRFYYKPTFYAEDGRITNGKEGFLLYDEKLGWAEIIEY
jgi:ribosomal protein S17E